jgi:hypothetical protein
MGKIIAIYAYSFAFIGSELVGSRLEFLFMFFAVAVLTVNVVILQYEPGRLVSFWVSVGFMALVYFYDFWFVSTPAQKRAFYMPMFFEAFVFGIGFLVYKFEFPERFCRNAKFVQLYLTGFIFYTLILLNCIYEAHSILYYTLKLNRGNYDVNKDDWWQMSNIFKKDEE